VNQINNYILNLKALADAKTVFEFKLNNKFFAQYEDVEINSGSVDVKITAEKRLANIELAFDLQGTIMVICDRCLEEMPFPIKYEEDILVKFGKSFDDKDEIIVIDENEGTLDVSWLCYEMIAAAVPAQHSHPFGRCDQDMMKHYNKYIVLDENEEI
jgi:uncharacterized metal-binding protein YceD (DUF177 family)